MVRFATSFVAGLAGGLVVAIGAFFYLCPIETTERPVASSVPAASTPPAATTPAPVKIVDAPKKSGQRLEPTDCARLLDEDPALGPQLPKWHFPPISEEVLHGIARGAGAIPLAAVGDFDGDSVGDVAFLILTRVVDAPSASEPDKKRIGVCLSGKPGTVTYIDDLYCSDGIDMTPKGSEYYDYDKDTKGHYEQDGVSTYCWEKAGATYHYKEGIFQRTVDSD